MDQRPIIKSLGRIPNPHIAPVLRIMAPDRCDWTQNWTELNSRSYWVKEAQVQSYMDKSESGYWCNMRVKKLLSVSVPGRSFAMMDQDILMFITEGCGQLFSKVDRTVFTAGAADANRDIAALRILERR